MAEREKCAASFCALPARRGISWRRACRRHGHRSREVTRSWGRRSAHPGKRHRPGEAEREDDLPADQPWSRSEEHTSELQSLMRISYAVFCLKKKKTITKTPNLQHT